MTLVIIYVKMNMISCQGELISDFQKFYGGMIMAIDVRAILKEFQDGLGEVAAMDGAFIDSFIDFDGKAGSLALDFKTRELISVAIGIDKRCKYCICVHVNNAYKAGATREEILGAAEVAMAFGGGPSAAYTATVLKAAIDEFEHDYD